MNDFRDLWGVTSHKVLASVLVDAGAVFPALDVIQQNAHWFPPKDAPIWRAVLQCVEQQIPPSVETVSTRGAVDTGYVQSIANAWTEEDNRRLVYNARELRMLGVYFDTLSAGQEFLKLDNPEDVSAAVETMTNRLSGIMADQTNRQADAISVSESAWAEVEAHQGNGIPTGFKWFDQLTGGIWPSMIYWVAGAYKMGKSTLLRNAVLHACEKGHAVDVFVAEGGREMFALDCQAMIATRLLCERGERVLDNLRLSGLFIKRAWRRGEAVLRKGELEAIHEARKIWESYNIRVWDTRDGITNLVTLRHRIQQSRLEHGSLVHWLDYSQLFGGGKTLFERQSQNALTFQRIAQKENVALCVLAQKNEAAIRDSSGYSVGVKGGGDASATADFLLVPRIDHELKNVYSVELKHSRHTGLGKGTHSIASASGLIVDRWFRQDFNV